MPRTRRNPIEVKLPDEQATQLITDLIDELDEAMAARGTLDQDASYWLALYEQQRTRDPSVMPWADAADLTSYIATEKVDALHSRLYRTVVGVEPIWSVEGWGEASTRAPAVEAFHQWKAEEERLQEKLDKVLLDALIFPLGILEVFESTQERIVRQRANVEVELDDMGRIRLENGQAVPRRDADGEMIETELPPYAEVDGEFKRPVRSGPSYRVVPFRDFYVLPSHARDRSEIWGYAKRFYRRMAELRERVEDGVYDAKAVRDLTMDGERPSDTDDERGGITVQNRTDERAEKELWEFLFLKDLDGRGERWYVATINHRQRKLLRLQYDDLGDGRYLLFSPIPRSDSVYGYSLIGHKLLTTVEEHTAWRNMNADKAALAVMGPIMRTTTSMWDPEEQPIGPQAVIDVNDPNELTPLQLPDIPSGALERERSVEIAADRLSGVNDTAAGQTSQPGTTLGEIQLTANQSFVRMDQMIRRVQETLEDLWSIRHEMYKRQLSESGDAEEMPPSVAQGLERQGAALPNGRIDARTLAGTFRGKPRGSVETADLDRMRFDFTQFLTVLPTLIQVFPLLAQQFQTPAASNAVMQEAFRVFRWQHRDAFMLPMPEQGGMMGGDPIQQLLASMGVGGAGGGGDVVPFPGVGGGDDADSGAGAETSAATGGVA